jgi:glycosyltransferase involved in cell wall biosynthesis
MVCISVIVPLYNKVDYIRRALDSIAAQTFCDFEVIVVDDGSTDGGGQLASAYPDARFRTITQANRGPGAARNLGVAEANADIITFLDADDEWLSDYLADGKAALDQYGPQVASFTSGYIECPAEMSTERMWRKRGLRDGIQQLNSQTSAGTLSHMLAYMSPCTTIVRARALRKWGGFYDQDRCVFGEDSLFWLKVLLNQPVAFHLSPRVRVHREASDLSKNLRRPRPLEPFLEQPAAIEAVCPAHLRDLLQRFYTLRAFKTACAWGYWGHWRQARSIRDRYRTPGDYRLPYYTSSLVCSTPLGAALGGLWRMVRS